MRTATARRAARPNTMRRTPGSEALHGAENAEQRDLPPEGRYRAAASGVCICSKVRRVSEIGSMPSTPILPGVSARLR